MRLSFLINFDPWIWSSRHFNAIYCLTLKAYGGQWLTLTVLSCEIITRFLKKSENNESDTSSTVSSMSRQTRCRPAPQEPGPVLKTSGFFAFTRTMACWQSRIKPGFTGNDQIACSTRSIHFVESITWWSWHTTHNILIAGPLFLPSSISSM